MHLDSVFWGAIATVFLAIVILVFLAFKVKQLIKRDTESHAPR